MITGAQSVQLAKEFWAPRAPHSPETAPRLSHIAATTQLAITKL